MPIVGRWFANLEPIAIEFDGLRVAGSRRATDAADLPLLIPGLVDLQVNGYGGIEFASADLQPEQVASVAGRCFQWGVTRFCPTLTTHSHEVLRHGLAAIRDACESDPAVNRLVAGVHLEGPSISPDEGPRGAHPAAHVRPPDWDELCDLQKASGGRIRLLTMAPEYPQAPEFIARAVASGIVVALGHHHADGSQIRAAVAAGARLSTHLGNGCHPVLPRHPNYLWEQLAEDRLLASVIVDGHHLPPTVVKSMIRAKGPQRIILVSDMAGQAGLAPGRYTGCGGPIEVLSDGRLVVADQRVLLAGASSPLSHCMFNAQRFTGLPWSSVVPMATSQPAELLGLETGSLRPGAPADFVLCRPTDEGLEVLKTIAGGNVVYPGASQR